MAPSRTRRAESFRGYLLDGTSITAIGDGVSRADPGFDFVPDVGRSDDLQLHRSAGQHRHPTGFYFADGGGGGRSLLKMSWLIFQVVPSFRSTTMYLPLSLIGWPVFGLTLSS